MAKCVVTQTFWLTVLEDWVRVNKAIQDRYGEVNAEYAEFLMQKQR